MAKISNASGLDRREEVDAPRYRTQVLPWSKRVEAIFDDPKKLQKWIWLFATIMVLTSFVPFVPELIFIFLLYNVFVYGSMKIRHWRAPYRVPAYASEYLKKKAGYGFLDATQEGKKAGFGEYYLGAEFPDENGVVSEVWAEANDLKTHRLVIGTTGSGKTEEFMGMFHNSLMLDSGLIFVDGKADPKTFKQMLSIARIMGREEDFLILNYLMSGRDPFGRNEVRSSNTYNPLSGGVPSQKAELMISLLSGGANGKSDIWSDRAEAFLTAIIEPLSFLESRGYVQFSPKLLGNFYLLENIENLFHFGIIIQDDGKPLTLNDPKNLKYFRDWQLLSSKFMGQIEQFLNTLPGYAGAKPSKPWPVRSLSAKDVADANIRYLSTVGELADELKKAEQAVDSAMSEQEQEQRQLDLVTVRKKVDDAFYSVIGRKIEENDRAARLAGMQDLTKSAQEKMTSFANGEPAKAMQSRDKVNEQFGYITMQLVRATNDLTFNYGHIYNVDQGEIDFRDVAFNRRILYITLPALTRSKSSMEQLGKMAVSAIKSLMGEMLNVPFEGVVRTTIDARPSNAHVPLPVILDEYGYYVVEGFSVAPAQARSFGFSMTFGVQDYPSLIRANQAEGEATFENTNLRHLGRTTGGAESETFKKLSGAAGNAFFFKDGSLEYERGRIGASFKRTNNISLETASRIDYNDLAGQRDGEFTLIVGTKSGNTKSGGVNVVRYTAYYTGNVPQVAQMRLMHYVMVRPLPLTEREHTLKRIEQERARKVCLRKWLSIDAGQLLDRIKERLDDIDKTFAAYSEANLNEQYLKPTYELQRLKAHSSYYLSGLNSAEKAENASDVKRLSSQSHIAKTILNNRFMASRARLRLQAQNDMNEIVDWLSQNGYPQTHISQVTNFLSLMADSRVKRDVTREKQVITGVVSHDTNKIMLELLENEAA